MKAKFIGKNGSMGFVTNKIYELKSTCENGHIVIRTIDKKLWCPYSSIESFLRNWEIVEI